MAEKTSYGTIFKSTFLFSFVQVVRILVGVIKNKIVAILLGAEGMGIMGLLNNAASLIKTGAGLGISQSAVRDISQANGTGDQVKISRIINVVRKVVLFTSFLGMFITIAFSPLLSKWEFGDATYTLSFVFLSISVFFEIFVDNQLAILKGTRQLRSLAKASIWGALIGLVTGVPLYFWLGVKGIVPSFIVSAFSTFFVTRYYVNKINYEHTSIPIRIVAKEAAPMVKMGAALMFTTLLGMISTFIIASYMRYAGGLSDVGFYNAGMAIVHSYFGVVITALTTDYYPRISAVNHDNEKLSQELNQQSLVSVLLTSPLIVLFLLLLPYFVKILYTDEFLPIVDFMKIAMFGTLITIVSNQADMIIVAKFKIKVFTIVAVSMRVFQVIISILLFKYLGLIGMGVAEALRALVHLIIFTVLDYKMYGIKFNSVFLRVAAIILLITISTVFVSELSNLWFRYSFGFILLLASVGLLIYSSKKYMEIDFMTLVKKKLQKKK